MTQAIEKLEAQLDSFDSNERKEALEKLWQLKQKGKIEFAETSADVNLHVHSFYSYNACGYSPSKIAWLAKKRGLAVAGIVDFDVFPNDTNNSIGNKLLQRLRDIYKDKRFRKYYIDMEHFNYLSNYIDWVSLSKNNI